MSSPSIFHAPIFEGKRQINGDSYQNKHGKKRKPVDPPEEGTIDHINYYDTTNNTHKRQRASPDDLFGTLSLKPPDPPAHSFCKRKKEENDDDSIGNSSDEDDVRYAKFPRLQNEDDAELKKGSIQLKRIDGDETSQLISSSTNAKPDPDETQQNTSEIDNGMSIDDNASINSNSDGSISEGSLQRAMYQAVFGRRNSAQHQFHSLPATISLSGGNGIGCYDAVDSKIEDLIRRSRIEAEIRRRKEELQQVTTEGVENSLSRDVANEDEKMEMDE
mmetsp:Transcript_21665/g.33972  ORF Transcript_21665/g.33972 Transcript_21665/m.33972 type:complete len:275 (-) Transcript_21665:123-947(-)